MCTAAECFAHCTSRVYPQMSDLLLPVLSLLKGVVSCFGACDKSWHVDSMKHGSFLNQIITVRGDWKQ